MTKQSDKNKKVTAACEREGRKHLLGLRIEHVRYLTAEEAEKLGWESRPVVLELENGTLVFPSMDDEGNDGGALFGQKSNGERVCLPVVRSYI